MQHTVALETALVFLATAGGAWWAGATIAYMVAAIFGVEALFCAIGNGLTGIAGYPAILAIGLLVAGYLRDHPHRG